MELVGLLCVAVELVNESMYKHDVQSELVEYAQPHNTFLGQHLYVFVLQVEVTPVRINNTGLRPYVSLC